MLIEDDYDIRVALTEILQDRGFVVQGAANGREALDLLRAEALPALILLDLMMPVMDGWDFRHEQLSDPVLQEIAVVVFTATGFSPEKVREQFGDVGVLAKPVCFPELFQAIERARRPAEVAA